MQTDGHIADARARLGLRIRELRKAQHLSQRAFAQMVGINRTYLIDVEYGRRNVSFDNLMKIAGGFGITMSELIVDVEYDGHNFPRGARRGEPKTAGRSSSSVG